MKSSDTPSPKGYGRASKTMDKKYNPSEIEARWPRKRLTSSQRLPASRSRGASLRGKQEYNPSVIESKWQSVWEKEKVYSPDLDKAKKPFYSLMMFPYPSAEGMHVGNMYAFTGADVYGRFQRMQGNDVFEPIGLDGFGIHSENYAIKVGNHPAKQAEISEKNFYRQLKSIGNSFDWTRTVETYKPEYYKWTQWLFIQLFKAGLAYRKKAPVNFCPSCKTVLADEQVVEKSKIKNQKSKIMGERVWVCERCETEIEKRYLEQWFFRITKYANRLLANIPNLDWSEKVKIAQKQWIGRSEGTNIKFQISNSKYQIDVFTTRADTLYGATFLVLSPEYPIVASLLNSKFKIQNSKLIEVKKYVEEARKRTDQERTVESKEKTGVFTGLYAINPVNNEKIPVWVADYVLMGYGTGAIMAVPAHDQRDFEFAKKFKISVKQIISSAKANIVEKAHVGEGKIINSGEWNGWKTPDSIGKVIDWLEKKGLGKKEANYHLRDWLISRQRYWGPPIPLVFCENCARRINDEGLIIKDEFNKGEMENPGWISIKEEDLPVKLPFIEDYEPLGTGQAPLASHPEFFKTKCPKCGMDAKRETDVSDTFLDSSWYFLRYIGTEFNDVPFPMENSNVQNSKPFRISDFDIRVSGQRLSSWLPVDMYIGGAEHSVLHLLYSRFITMVIHDLGFIGFEEPFAKFRAHGLIVKDGVKMSKSKGNVVIPDQYVKKFGADTLRTYLMFMGSFDQGGDFRDSGIEGMHRFIKRVWNLTSSIKYQVLSMEGKDASSALDSLMHKTIKNVTDDIENLSYNTAIAHLMEYYNGLFSFYTKYKILNTKYCKTLVLLLAPFAPHVSEELYQLLTPIKSGLNQKKEFYSIHKSAWPKYNPKFLIKDELAIIIQVNGKFRGTLIVDLKTSKNKAGIEELAGKNKRVQARLDGKSIKKVIHVEGKVLNFVTSV